MLETSKDVFWLVLSLVILLSGLGISWGIFYAVLMLRDVKKITKSLRKKMDLVDQILEIIKKTICFSFGRLILFNLNKIDLILFFRLNLKSSLLKDLRVLIWYLQAETTGSSSSIFFRKGE